MRLPDREHLRHLAMVGSLVVGATTAANLSSAYATEVSFNNLNAGDSVIGDGTVQNGLTISIGQDGQGVALFENEKPSAYGAPNKGTVDGQDSKLNGGISEDGGFGDISDDRRHLFAFEFESPISAFELRVLDFGDYNPYGATEHTFGITGYNDDTGETRSSSVFFESSTATNPGKPDGLYVTGDAVTANGDRPGNVLLMLPPEETGTFLFSRVELFYDSDLDDSDRPTDPNIAFTDLAFTPAGEQTDVPVPGTLGLLGAALISLGYSMRRRQG